MYVGQTDATEKQCNDLTYRICCDTPIKKVHARTQHMTNVAMDQEHELDTENRINLIGTS